MTAEQLQKHLRLNEAGTSGGQGASKRLARPAGKNAVELAGRARTASGHFCSRSQTRPPFWLMRSLASQ